MKGSVPIYLFIYLLSLFETGLVCILGRPQTQVPCVAQACLRTLPSTPSPPVFLSAGIVGVFRQALLSGLMLRDNHLNLMIMPFSHEHRRRASQDLSPLVSLSQTHSLKIGEMKFCCLHLTQLNLCFSSPNRPRNNL